MEIKFPSKCLNCIEVPPWITFVLRGWDYGIVILLVILFIFLVWRIITVSASQMTVQYRKQIPWDQLALSCWTHRPFG